MRINSFWFILRCDFLLCFFFLKGTIWWKHNNAWAGDVQKIIQATGIVSNKYGNDVIWVSLANCVSLTQLCMSVWPNFLWHIFWVSLTNFLSIEPIFWIYLTNFPCQTDQVSGLIESESDPNIGAAPTFCITLTTFYWVSLPNFLCHFNPFSASVWQYFRVTFSHFSVSNWPSFWVRVRVRSKHWCSTYVQTPSTM